MVDVAGERDDSSLFRGGSCQAVGLVGVWVPDGMTAEMVLAGAAEVQRAFDIDTYTARSIARRVWAAANAVRQPAANPA